MLRDEFDFSVRDAKCMRGGVKEACYIVREYLQNVFISKNDKSPLISTREFFEAIRILVAYSWVNRKDDKVINYYYVGNYSKDDFNSKGDLEKVCLIAGEYLNRMINDSNSNFNSPHSAVSRQEFFQALRVLITYCYEKTKEDVAPIIPELHYCDNDCSKIGKYFFCNGEFQIAGEDEEGYSLSKKLCSYFQDSWDI